MHGGRYAWILIEEFGEGGMHLEKTPDIVLFGYVAGAYGPQSILKKFKIVGCVQFRITAGEVQTDEFVIAVVVVVFHRRGIGVFEIGEQIVATKHKTCSAALNGAGFVEQIVEHPFYCTGFKTPEFEHHAFGIPGLGLPQTAGFAVLQTLVVHRSHVGDIGIPMGLKLLHSFPKVKSRMVAQGCKPALVGFNGLLNFG